MTQRRALGDLDQDAAFDDSDDGWFGQAEAAEPEPPHPAHAPHDEAEPADGDDDTDRLPVVTLDEPVAAHDRRPHVTGASWESRLSHSGAWDFKPAATGRRIPGKVVAPVLIAAGIAAAVAVFLLMHGPGRAPDDSTATPAETTAQPAPSSSPVGPTPTPPPSPVAPPSPPPPAPPPPPPGAPPPTAQEMRPPTAGGDYAPRQQSTPGGADKPEVGVTRAPATRTQMSATPPPPRAPDRNSSTPGDGPKRNGFGF